MKKILFCTFLLLLSLSVSAQNNTKEPEVVSPTTNTEIYRQVTKAKINNKYYYENIGITIKSKYDWWYGLTPIIKIKVKSLATGKIIYKKKFNNTYLYVFSSGQIQVGKPRLDKLVIFKSTTNTNMWCLEINDGGIF